MVQRFPRRLIRHLEATDLPLETLESIRLLRLYLDELEGRVHPEAHRLGASPIDIGETLGITRQAVHKRLRTLELRAATNQRFVVSDLDIEATQT